MIVDKTKEFNLTAWRRVNMRNVNHLLGVEFLHDLYNQHVSRINSVRFRNTVTIWKNNVANSYAPCEEFNMLEKYFGDRLFNLDDRTISEIKKLLKGDRKYFMRFLRKCHEMNLSKLNNKELFNFLCDVQYQSLGELYRLNFVQVEYSLTSAIKRELSNLHIRNADEFLSKVIATNIPTEFQLEEIEFLKILRRKRTLSEQMSDGTKLIISKHCDKFSHMHCAYGEDPYRLEHYMAKWHKYDPSQNASEEIRKIRINISESFSEGRRLLKEVKSKRLNILVSLMARGGTFRDMNKSYLGQTIRYKYAVMDEIVSRGLESAEQIRLYLLNEFGSLLVDNRKVNSLTLEKRAVDGITLKRIESAVSEHNSNYSMATIDSNSKTGTAELKGRCACSGRVRGQARIVTNNKDAEAVKESDIMVAIGTDFDLMDAIHRAAAVVTEEGGLLSHASVVCREMQKPCLIGVLNATTQIRDGDDIEVDATNNLVRIHYE